MQATKHARQDDLFFNSGLTLNGSGDQVGKAIGATWLGSQVSLRRLLQRPPNKRHLLIVFRQLALLVETGIDVAEALELVASTCRQPMLREGLENIHAAISKGQSLSSAVTAEQRVLGREVAASIQAGEASGRLVEVLRQIAHRLEEEMHFRSTLMGSLAYPLILCVAASAVAAILIWFVLPQFEESFESMGVEPPLFTELLLSTAETIREHVLIVGLGGLALLAAIPIALAQPRCRQQIGNLCFVSPIVGRALRNLSVGHLFCSLGHLLSNGLSLLEAIQLVGRSTLNGSVRRLTEVWEHDVLEGRGLTHSLDDFHFLPEGSAAMLVMAEKTGRLEAVLSTAGKHYREEGSSQLRQFLKLSEPLIIILLGIFVGVVVASVLLPILDVQAGAGA